MINKKWSNWIDIEVRNSYDGRHFLLQMKVSNKNKKVFRNRPLDNYGFYYLLFHGFYDIANKIIKKDNL